MKTVTKRELNQSTAQVLREVTEGEEVTVTQRGMPRWRIVSHRTAETPLQRWRREGLYTPPASDPMPWGRFSSERAYSSAEVDELLKEERGDH